MIAPCSAPFRSKFASWPYRRRLSRCSSRLMYASPRSKAKRIRDAGEWTWVPALVAPRSTYDSADSVIACRSSVRRTHCLTDLSES